MGDLQAWSSQPNGILTEDHPLPSSPLAVTAQSSNPHPLSIGADCWLRAEQTTQEIICRIQPTVVSEQRRKAVIDYVQRLIRGYLGSEVFPFGSVPLKTYLPDGDIDLTALGSQNVEDALANDVRSVLEGEEQSNATEFEVKDVQYIHAEVKLVKCLVQNIVVDISFNQLGGLSTLCFLEQVDRLIGKDNLFKRSIILIKAWCYYESRILGAHHGLISTYALETLVLYIFHLFHSSLNGPLAVLYRFLDYFSKFDWDNYCISLNGPVYISALPQIVAETPENDGGDVLISEEFLRSCVEMFSVPSRGPENNSRAFPQKHLNIVDPLKENNNLGRSVSKGNFYRIRSAFTYGARKLGKILSLPEESIENEVNNFFMNTLDRHGSGQRPDVQDPVPPFGANGSVPASFKSFIEKSREDKIDSESRSIDSSGTVGESWINPPGSLCDRISNLRISGTEKKPGSITSNEPERRSSKVITSPTVLEVYGFANGNAVSDYRLAGDAEDLATPRIQGSKITDESPTSELPNSEPGILFGKAHYAPHLFFSHSFPENEKTVNKKPDRTKTTNSGIPENKLPTRLPQVPDEETGVVSWTDAEETEALAKNSFSNQYQEGTTSAGLMGGFQISSRVAYPSEDLYFGFKEDMAVTAESAEAMNSLSYLSGDYDSHLKSLLYAQRWHECTFGGPILPIPPSSSQYQNKRAWNTFHRSMQLKRNVFAHMNTNGVVRGPPFYPVNSPIIPGTGFGVEEMPKPRGTGTYFPNMNHRSYIRERPSAGRGRQMTGATHGQLQRPTRNNGRAVTPPEKNLVESGGHELSPIQFPLLPGREKPGPLEFLQPGRPAMRVFPHANGVSHSSESLEFGSFGSLQLGAPSLEASRHPDLSTQHTKSLTSSLPSPVIQRPRPVLGMKQERVAVQSYHLKDENDFPPLSV